MKQVKKLKNINMIVEVYLRSFKSLFEVHLIVVDCLSIDGLRLQTLNHLWELPVIAVVSIAPTVSCGTMSYDLFHIKVVVVVTDDQGALFDWKFVWSFLCFKTNQHPPALENRNFVNLALWPCKTRLVSTLL